MHLSSKPNKIYPSWDFTVLAYPPLLCAYFFTQNYLLRAITVVDTVIDYLAKYLSLKIFSVYPELPTPCYYCGGHRYCLFG